MIRPVDPTDRAWVALRLVDQLAAHRVAAHYDGHHLVVADELIDVGSVTASLNATPRHAWVNGLQPFANRLVARHTTRRSSAPLGRIAVPTGPPRDFADLTVPSPPTESGNRVTARVPRHASSLRDALSAAPARPAATTVRIDASAMSPAARLGLTADAGPITTHGVDFGVKVSQPPASSAPPMRVADSTPVVAAMPATIHEAVPTEPAEPVDHQPTPVLSTSAHVVVGEDTARLATALSELTVRTVDAGATFDLDRSNLLPSPIPGAVAALSCGEQWVTAEDLAAWGIDRSMALDIAERRVRDDVSPSIEMVLVDATSRVFVLETEAPDIAAVVCFLEQHIPIRADDTIWVSLGGDHVAVVSLDRHPNAAASSLLIDGAVTEYDRRGGRLRPALYVWSDGAFTPVATDLDTAAGRLTARARLGATVDSR